MNKNQVTRIIDTVNEISQLSITEEDILDSIFNLFSANKTEKIKQLEHLLNDEYDTLLSLIPEDKVNTYAIRNLDLIENDKDSLVSALEDLNYKFIDAVDVDDMILKIERCGYTITEDNGGEKYDIVTKSDLDELISNFLSVDFEKRKLMLKL